MKPFRDRQDAGRRLAEKLAASEIVADNPIVLGLPRGGVAVAKEVSRQLCMPLDIFLVRKLGVPGEEELAMGSIASGGVTVLNDDVIDAYGVSPQVVEAVAQREQAELERRERLYRRGHPAPGLAGRTVILVDDGLATGASMRAAVAAVREHKARRVVVAVPVGARSTCTQLGHVADEVVCAETPWGFQGVGQWYRDFHQVSDEEVQRDLEEAGRRE